MAEKVSGGCLCGGVQYEYTGKPISMVNCHCTMCRKAIGASFGTFIQVPLANIKFLKDSTMKVYASSDKVERHFCGNCGGNIMDIATFAKEYVGLTGGSVTGDPGIALQSHIFTNYKAPWVKIDDGLPCSKEMELLEHLLTAEKK